MNFYIKLEGKFRRNSRSSFINSFITEMKHEFVYHILHMINHNTTTDVIDACSFNTLLMDFVDGEPRLFWNALVIMQVHNRNIVNKHKFLTGLYDWKHEMMDNTTLIMILWSYNILITWSCINDKIAALLRYL